MAGHRRKGFGSFAQVANLLRIGGIAASYTAKVFRIEIAAALVDLMQAKHTYGEFQNTLASYIAYSLPCISASIPK